jgi:hypothetical protein
VRTVVLWSFLTGSLAAQDTAWLFRDVSVRPSPRSGRTLTFQGHSGKALLFSENILSNDTWEWDGADWTLLTPAISPLRRHGAAAAYDPSRRKTVLFSGETGLAPTNDTWEWDGINWQQKNPVHRPSPRVGHAMVFDPVRQRVVLYGGLDDGRLPDDTWTWDGTDWTQVAIGSPPGRQFHAMAFDEARAVVVLFGGISMQGLLNDTWEWDGSTWRNVTLSPAPRPRLQHAMAYHTVRHRVILFGGNAQFGGGFLNETLEWDGASRTWILLQPVANPGPRINHGLVYDRWRSRMVLFGGFYSSNLDETWTFSEIPLTAWPVDPTPGQTITLLLNSVRDPGAGYVLACSFSRIPGIPILPDGRVISLGPDLLLFWSMGSLVPPFLGFQGGLNGSGWAQASILLPAEPALGGLRFFVSGFVYDALGVRTVLNEVELRVRSS